MKPGALLDERVLTQISEMIECLAARGTQPTGMWERLSDRHIELIRSFGFLSFKRTINFEYHQWGVSRFRDEIIWRVLGKLLLRGRLPWYAFFSKAEDPANTVWPTKTSSIAAYKFYVGLLWQYALAEDALGCLAREEPQLGWPINIAYKGKLLTQDLAYSSLELNAIARSCGPMTSIQRVLEVGAGYGRLAWLYQSVFPEAQYFIVDVPPALAVSQNYLSECLGADRVEIFRQRQREDYRHMVELKQKCNVHCLLPHELEELPDKFFDLAINISSFDEMPRSDVAAYFAQLDRTVRRYVYLKGYKFNRLTQWDYRDFPYLAHWTCIMSRTEPSNKAFVEQIFRLDSAKDIPAARIE